MKSITTGVLVIALLSSSAAFAKPDHGNGNGNSHAGGNWQSNGNGNNGNHGNGNGNGNNGRHAGWGQDRGNQYKWARGQRMGYNDWRNAPVVNYRNHHLRQPPRGYQWRQQNDQFILVAVATGLIASIILNSGR